MSQQKKRLFFTRKTARVKLLYMSGVVAYLFQQLAWRRAVRYYGPALSGPGHTASIPGPGGIGLRGFKIDG